MSTKKSGNGTDSAADSDDLRAVTGALRSIAGDGERVSLAQLVSETGLSPARVECAMCNIETVAARVNASPSTIRRHYDQATWAEEFEERRCAAETALDITESDHD